MRDFCLSLPLTDEVTPFDDEHLVFRVCGKMFALCSMDDYRWVSLKCDPDRAVELRERYAGKICPAWHFNKKHWNMADALSDLPAEFMRELVRHSYDRVVAGLPRAQREEILRAVRLTV